MAGIIEFFKNIRKKDDNFISAKEIKKISKANREEMKRLETERKKLNPENMFTQMKDPNNILEVENLHVNFYTDLGIVRAVGGVSFSVPRKSTVGIVGESGCGKSVTSLSIMKLLNRPMGQIIKGQIRFNIGDDIVKIYQNKKEQKAIDICDAPDDIIRKIRGNLISMIFQEPMTSLNPVFTVGSQIDEVLLLHTEIKNKKEAQQKTKELIKSVGIGNADGIYKKYPHELSGGMRQRIVIAMALACSPRLIIADEPTTALDVTIQAQVLDLLQEIKKKTEGSIILITHDLGVVAEMADFVVIMYAGKVVERGTVHEIFKNPLHPYTIGLMKSKPMLNNISERLYNIPGNVPNPINLPDHCYFYDRCEFCQDRCRTRHPKLLEVTPTHFVACPILKEKELLEKTKK